jgi:hypothetical protein
MAEDCAIADVASCSDVFSDGSFYPNRYPGARHDMKVSMYLEMPATLTRTVTQWALSVDGRKTAADYRKTLSMGATGATALGHGAAYTRTSAEQAAGADGTGRAEGLWRRLPGVAGAADAAGSWGDYVRGLLAEAGAVAETGRRGDYRRNQADTANSLAVSLRHLLVFVRLATVSFVRDYIIGRFLKSKEELIIKSPVCREIELDSRMNN